jgi:hypothetical protein
VPQRADAWDADAERPQAPQPAKPLPPIAADGTLTGYEAGWRLTTSPIQVSPTLDVDLKAVALTTFSLEGGSVDMAQIKDHGPKTSLYVGVGNGFLVVKDGGVYALSARLERPAASVADCLVRLGFGSRRIVSNLEVGISGELSKNIRARALQFATGPVSDRLGIRLLARWRGGRSGSDESAHQPPRRTRSSARGSSGYRPAEIGGAVTGAPPRQDERRL